MSECESQNTNKIHMIQKLALQATQKKFADFVNKYKTINESEQYNLDLETSKYMTIELAQTLLDWDHFSTEKYSASIYVTLEDIENNPSFPWNWFGVSKNPNLTLAFIKKHLDKDLCWMYITGNKSISIESIQENLDLPWFWKTMDLRNDLTEIFIRNNIDKDWDWYYVKRKYEAAFESIKDLIPEYKSSNPQRISCDGLRGQCPKENVHRYLANSTSSNNKSIDFYMHNYEFNKFKNCTKKLSFVTVLENPHTEWNWLHLSFASFIDIDDVLENFNKPWNFYVIVLRKFNEYEQMMLCTLSITKIEFI